MKRNRKILSLLLVMTLILSFTACGTKTTQTSTKTETIDNLPQTIVKQRNVSKIIILYDDGSFQEM